MELNDESLKTYPPRKIPFDFEMSEDDHVAFQKDLDLFIKERLGDRAYLCIISYDSTAVGRLLIRDLPIGLENPVGFMRTVNCLKAVATRINAIYADAAAPLQPITPENNPVVQQEKK